MLYFGENGDVAEQSTKYKGLSAAAETCAKMVQRYKIKKEAGRTASVGKNKKEGMGGKVTREPMLARPQTRRGGCTEYCMRREINR